MEDSGLTDCAEQIFRDNRALSMLQTVGVMLMAPLTGYGYVYNLDSELTEKVQEAFFTDSCKGSGSPANLLAP